MALAWANFTKKSREVVGDAEMHTRMSAPWMAYALQISGKNMS